MNTTTTSSNNHDYILESMRRMQRNTQYGLLNDSNHSIPVWVTQNYLNSIDPSTESILQDYYQAIIYNNKYQETKQTKKLETSSNTNMNKNEVKKSIKQSIEYLKQLFNDYKDTYDKDIKMDYLTNFCFKYVYGLDAVRTLKRFNRNVKEKIESDPILKSGLDCILLSNTDETNELIDRIFFPLDSLRINPSEISLKSNVYLDYDSYNGRRCENGLIDLDPNSFSYGTTFEIGVRNNYRPHFLKFYDIINYTGLYSIVYLYIENVKCHDKDNVPIEYQTLRLKIWDDNRDGSSGTSNTTKQIIIQYDPYNHRNKCSLTNYRYVSDYYILNTSSGSNNNDIVIISNEPIFSNEFIDYMNKLKRVLHTDTNFDIDPTITTDSEIYIDYKKQRNPTIHKTLYIHQLLFKHVIDTLDKHYPINNNTNKPLLQLIKDHYINHYQQTENIDDREFISKTINSCDYSNLDISIDYYIDNIKSTILTYADRTRDKDH